MVAGLALTFGPTTAYAATPAQTAEQDMRAEAQLPTFAEQEESGELMRKEVNGANVLCDGGFRFNWHWEDNPYFFDQTMVNSTTTITRCWDGQGNLTTGTTAKVQSQATNWGTGPFTRYEATDGDFQITDASEIRFQGYLPIVLKTCTDWGCRGEAQVDQTITIAQDGVMEVGSEPPPFVQQSQTPRFVADDPTAVGDDTGQFAPPPPQP
jgi:hypothetical protein